MRSIHWSELPGNKYLKKFEPAMFADQEFTCLQTIRLIGQSRTTKPETVKVIYDAAYVRKKLIIEVIEPLQIQSLDDLFKITGAAWISYCQQLKQAG